MVDNKVPLKGRAGLTARMSWHDKLFFLLSLVFTPIAIYMIYSSFPAFFSNSATVFNICAAPLPDFLSIEPIPTDHPLLLKAIESFENDLQTVFSDNNLDSLSVAIVTPRQPIFEWFRGPLQANDTQSQAQVDRHSIYRIASVSKLFTAMETLILRNRGALNLDDLVSDYIPELAYPLVNGSYIDQVTIRQLLSHMSGVVIDWPPGNGTGYWPNELANSGPPPYNNMPIPSIDMLYTALRSNSSIFLTKPYTMPIYSNIGYILLGYVNAFAEAKHANRTSPLDPDDLVQRDIFQPLGFQDSSLSVTDENRDRLVVSSSQPWETDVDFGIYNPSGGIYSSLSDLEILAQFLLGPLVNGTSVLPPITLREWFKPLHNNWDGYTAVGMLWELTTALDTFGQLIPFHAKIGDLLSHHSMIALSPERPFAIVVLNTGLVAPGYLVANLAVERFLPAFDAILATRAEEQLEGVWMSNDNTTQLILNVENGSLFTNSFIIQGVNALTTLGLPDDPESKLPIWYMGNEQYRIRTYGSTTGTNCLAQFGLDNFAYVNNAPVTLFRLDRNPDDPTSNIINVPSLQVDLKRNVTNIISYPSYKKDKSVSRLPAHGKRPLVKEHKGKVEIFSQKIFT